MTIKQMNQLSIWVYGAEAIFNWKEVYIANESINGSTRKIVRMETVSRGMEKVISYVVAVLLVLMSVTMFGNVIFRYFLDFSLVWKVA